MRNTTLSARTILRQILASSIIFCMVVSTQSSIGSAKTEAKSSGKSDSKKSNKDSIKSNYDKPSDKEEEKPPQKKSSDVDNDEAEEEPSKTPVKKEPTPTPAPITPENLPDKLGQIISSVAKNSNWGVKVVLTETGQTLFESQSERGFIPASNRKLFTGALAFDQLGPDYVFQTFLYYTGSIDSQGTLNGNLVVVPSGDPTFSTTLYKGAQSDWVFRDWAAKVQAAGIKNINGDLLIDCSKWDMNDLTPQGWASRVLNESYAPQTSPLTINENIMHIVLTPGKSGTPASVSYIPAATGYPVVNKTESGKQGRPSAKRVVNSHIEILGGVPSKQTLWSFPIDRPTLFAAANFRHHLAANNIAIQKDIRLVSTPGIIPPRTNPATLAMVQSPKMSEIVNYMMKRSDNHIAEQLYVAVSAAKLGKGSYANSRRLEADLLSRAKVNPASVQAMDGSGLSETNRVSPDQVCRLLAYMKTHPYAQAYYDSMAISGRDGTLRNRMGHIAGRVHAKTGTINRVKTLSGYLTLSPTQTVAFSFLVNEISGGSVSGVQDRLCSTIASLIL